MIDDKSLSNKKRNSGPPFPFALLIVFLWSHRKNSTLPHFLKQNCDTSVFRPTVSLSTRHTFSHRHTHSEIIPPVNWVCV